MKKKSPGVFGLAVLLTVSMGVPSEVQASPDEQQQRAGEVSRVIPSVSIARGSKTITASSKTVVDWQDQVNTQANARARISLDDGSVLNVGSDSSLKVAKHDAGAQQTQLELTYGKLRSQAQKISKPDGKFEVRTPAGVAGVVGTDFYTGFDSGTGTMDVIVFEGVVRFCNLAGACVEVKAGQMSSVRTGDNNSAPTPPTQASLALLTDAGKNTNSSGASGLETAGQLGHHIGPGTAVTLGILAAIPAIVIPVVATHGKGSTLPATCDPRQNPNGCGGQGVKAP